MDEIVRILYVDDNLFDRELVLDALQKEHKGFQVTLAGSRTEFESALASQQFDVVLSDFNIRGYEGLQVLDAVQEKHSSLPVILVTGTGSEEIAVEAMKRGAADYLIKSVNHLRRLPHTINAVLQKNRLELENKRAVEALRDSEARYRRLTENAQDIIYHYRLAPPRGFEYVNQAATMITGYTPEEYYADPDLWGKMVHPDDIHLIQVATMDRLETPLVIRWIHKNGSIIWTEQRNVPVFDESGAIIAIEGIARDITAQKNAEQRIKTQLQHLASLHTIDLAITSCFDLKLVLRVVVEQAISQLGVDAACVLLFNPHLQTLTYAAGNGFRGKAIEKSNLQLGEGQAGRAARERKIVSVYDLSQPEVDFARHSVLSGENFVCYHAVPLIAKGEMKGVLEVYSRTQFTGDKEWFDFFKAIASQTAIAIDNAQLFENLQHANVDLALAYDATIEGWSRALDLRDKETEGHTQRVADMTRTLARAIGIQEAQIVHFRRGALLHDIGKMGIPDSILLKPDPLTSAEWDIMHKHPVYAYDLLLPIQYLRPALDIPYCHHEKWDGTGYPRGLKREQIPLAARIFAVVDVYDALRSNRPYRPGWQEDKIIDYIRSQSGQHFDPDIVDLFLNIKEQKG